MSNWPRDFELPGCCNDADMEMAALERAGNIASNLRKKGICLHGGRDSSLEGGLVKCRDCGKIATWQELDADRKKYI